MDPLKKKELEKACRLVERAVRLVGRDCEVIFMDDGVQIALLEESGCTVNDTLFETLMEVLEDEDSSL